MDKLLWLPCDRWSYTWGEFEVDSTSGSGYFHIMVGSYNGRELLIRGDFSIDKIQDTAIVYLNPFPEYSEWSVFSFADGKWDNEKDLDTLNKLANSNHKYWKHIKTCEYYMSEHSKEVWRNIEEAIRVNCYSEYKQYKQFIENCEQLIIRTRTGEYNI